MTVLEEGLYSYLSGYAGLTALIGTRIYPVRLPQGALLPCLTYQRMTTPRIMTHDTSGMSGTLAEPRLQFDAWAETYKECKDITDQVRAALNGKTGSIGTSPNAVTIRAALVDNELSEYYADVELYRIMSDYIIWQEE